MLLERRGHGRAINILDGHRRRRGGIDRDGDPHDSRRIPPSVQRRIEASLT
jgi:hypothetical protein